MTVPFSNDRLASLRDGLQLLQRGEAPTAEAMSRQALHAMPMHAGWTGLLALALSASGRPADALPLYRQLVEQESGHAAHWSNLGNCLCELAREHEALAPLQRARMLGADDAPVHYALARVHASVGPARTGLHHIARAIALAPDDIEFRLLRARLLTAVDDWEQAKADVEDLFRWPLDAAQRVELAFLLLRGGLNSDAQQLFAAVLDEDPDQLDARIGLITTLERINRTDEAERERRNLEARMDPASATRLHDKLLQVDARLAARRGDHARACSALGELLSTGLQDPALRISLRFDLGLALDKCGKRGEAMDAFALAHAERRAIVGDDHPALTRGDSVYVALAEPLPRNHALLAPPVDDKRLDPVFVVGFPRSGTTLLEQLLDAHSGLVSFDEQPFVQRIVKRLSAQNTSLQHAVDSLDERVRGDLRDSYFADVAQVVANQGVRRPVDKNPLNLVRLPLLPRIFPGSRVILALRHPCDVVLSCYMQHFGAPAFAVTFETIDAGAQMYDRVFSHWWSARDHFALPVHVLRYEDLVSDVEGQARGLLAFLQLQWEPELLQFTQRARAKGTISTPSYTQVIEPVNSKAVGRWQAYREHFSPAALARLAPWIERFGYQQ